MDIILFYVMVKTDILLVTIFNVIVSVVLKTAKTAFILISNGILHIYRQEQVSRDKSNKMFRSLKSEGKITKIIKYFIHEYIKAINFEKKTYIYFLACIKGFHFCSYFSSFFSFTFADMFDKNVHCNIASLKRK